MPKTCEHCKGEYNPRRSDAKYCPTCAPFVNLEHQHERNRANPEYWREYNRIRRPVTCRECGQIIDTPRPGQRYHSECAAQRRASGGNGAHRLMCAWMYTLLYSPLRTFTRWMWTPEELNAALHNDEVPIGAVFLGYDDRPRLVVNGPNGLKLELEKNGAK